ncbi:MAG: SUF system Fe-S cluster assembly protein [Gammaproteobacteria bacterium]
MSEATQAKSITGDIDQKEKEQLIDELRQRVILALSEVYDPEIPVNIYDLGLIYDIEVTASGDVAVQMTLTTPGCPVAQTFPGMVENAILAVEGVTHATVILVWDPPWTPDRMSEAARLQLGMFD